MASDSTQAKWQPISDAQLQSLATHEDEINLPPGNYIISFPKSLHSTCESMDKESMSVHQEMLKRIFDLALSPVNKEVKSFNIEETFYVLYNAESSELLLKCYHVFSFTICPKQKKVRFSDLCLQLQAGGITITANRKLVVTEIEERLITQFDALSSDGGSLLELLSKQLSAEVSLSATPGRLEFTCSKDTNSIVFCAQKKITISRL